MKKFHGEGIKYLFLMLEIANFDKKSHFQKIGFLGWVLETISIYRHFRSVDGIS